MFADRIQTDKGIIAVDLRCRGQSEKPLGGHYGFARHTRDIKDLLKALDI